MDEPYPLTLSIDYPDRPLDRLTSGLRIFTAIPIAILLATLGGGPFDTGARFGFGAGGIVGGRAAVDDPLP